MFKIYLYYMELVSFASSISRQCAATSKHDALYTCKCTATSSTALARCNGSSSTSTASAATPTTHAGRATDELLARMYGVVK